MIIWLRLANIYHFFISRALSKLNAVATVDQPPSKMCDSMKGSLIKKQVIKISFLNHNILHLCCRIPNYLEWLWCISRNQQQIISKICLCFCKLNAKRKSYFASPVNHFPQGWAREYICNGTVQKHTLSNIGVSSHIKRIVIIFKIYFKVR